jgi:hypothetical protein
MRPSLHFFVIPAQAGIHCGRSGNLPIQPYGKCGKWIPAFAGMTGSIVTLARKILEIFSEQ